MFFRNLEFCIKIMFFVSFGASKTIKKGDFCDTKTGSKHAQKKRGKQPLWAVVGGRGYPGYPALSATALQRESVPVPQVIAC